MNQFDQYVALLSFHNMMQQRAHQTSRRSSRATAPAGPSRARRAGQAGKRLLIAAVEVVHRGLRAGISKAHAASPLRAMPGLPVDEVAPQR